MNRVMKAATSVGVVALVLSGAAMAAPPAGFNASAAANGAVGEFDSWSVTSGSITIKDMDTNSTATVEDCPPGYTCGTAVVGDGFYQRQVTRDSDAASYFQTIIVDSGASVTGSLDELEFADESFVQTGNNSGLADKQRVSSTDGSITFATVSKVNAGWAAVGDENMNVAQSVVDTSANGFRTDFFFDQTGSASNPTESRMKISGTVGMTSTDNQDFVLIQMSGDYVSGATTQAVLAGSTGGTLDWTQDTTLGSIGVEGAGGTEGDQIKAIWVGQNMTAVNQVFGFTSFANEEKEGIADDPTVTISEFSLTDSAAKNWDSANVWGANSLITSGVGF